MKKKLKPLMTFLLVTILLLGNTISVFAASPSMEDQQLKYVMEGYTEEGIHFIVHEIVSDTSAKSEVGPQIVVSMKKTYSITYEGHITPPATFSYSGYESYWNTNMSGTLYLKMYNHDIWPHFPKSTNATYEGTIVGNI